MEKGMYIVFRKWKEMRKLGLPFMSQLVAFIMSAILLSCLDSLLLSVYGLLFSVVAIICLSDKHEVCLCTLTVHSYNVHKFIHIRVGFLGIFCTNVGRL